MSSTQETKLGGMYAAAAFTAWGLFPIYFKTLGSIPAFEILCHRAVWAAVWLAIWIHYKNQWHRVKDSLSSRTTYYGQLLSSPIYGLLLSSLLIATNWVVFMWAVNAGRVLETSLGYFITPMINILLGWIFLKERLRITQWLAVALAVCGTLNLIFQFSQFPWVSLGLAFSFGFYALVRKVISVEALPGLFIETMILSPLLLLYLIYLGVSGQSHFLTVDLKTDLLLASAGLITFLPLLWFANAARRLQLTTLGFFQYIAPSMTFLMAILLFKENFTVVHLITFSLIWGGLLVFTIDNVRYARRQTPAALETAAAKN